MTKDMILSFVLMASLEQCPSPGSLSCAVPKQCVRGVVWYTKPMAPNLNLTQPTSLHLLRSSYTTCCAYANYGLLLSAAVLRPAVDLPEL